MGLILKAFLHGIIDLRVILYACLQLHIDLATILYLVLPRIIVLAAILHSVFHAIIDLRVPGGAQNGPPEEGPHDPLAQKSQIYNSNTVLLKKFEIPRQHLHGSIDLAAILHLVFHWKINLAAGIIDMGVILTVLHGIVNLGFILNSFLHAIIDHAF